MLRLAWQPPGAAGFATVTERVLRVEKGLTRVTSPGLKVVLDGNEHLRPGDGLPLKGVHPMWTVETVRPEGVQHRIGAMDFLPGGALVYSEFIPVNNGILRERTNGTLYRLDGVDGGQGRAKSMPVKIAEGFHDPSGIVCIGTDIWVSHRPGSSGCATRTATGTTRRATRSRCGWGATTTTSRSACSTTKTKTATGSTGRSRHRSISRRRTRPTRCRARSSG
jgi:hypothetical protein